MQVELDNDELDTIIVSLENEHDQALTIKGLPPAEQYKHDAYVVSLSALLDKLAKIAG